MSKRKRKDAASPNFGWLEMGLIGGVTALLVAWPLIPGEAPLEEGVGLPLVVISMALLLTWALWGVVSGRLSVTFGATDGLLAAFALWTFLSAIVAANRGAPRAAINGAWQWTALVVTFFLVRQLLAAPATRRAIAAVMIALAASLSAYGMYQYFEVFPADRAMFRDDPEAILRQIGVDPDDPRIVAQFRNRLESTEPYATFGGLANSLAGFLVPWLMVLLGAAAANLPMLKANAWMRWGGAATGALLLGCLLLTKSRTAWLAALAGVAVLVAWRLVALRGRWHVATWKIIATVGALAMLLVAAVGVGGVDWEVVSEAGKSFSYRLQYWTATWGVIADYPLLGAGPGNFKQAYTAHMLPQASEAVSDPHNFLLEIWATTGVGGAAIFIFALAAWLWTIWRSSEGDDAASDSSSNDVKAIYAGAVAGVALGWMVGLVVGYPVASFVLVIGVPLGGAVLFAMRQWINEGILPVAALAVAVAAMLVNLLAAGGISYPGVSASLWLLLAISLNGATNNEVRAVIGPKGIWLAALLCGSLLAGCWLTAYLPSTTSNRLMNQAQIYQQPALYDAQQAQRLLEQAAQADPLSYRPWMRLAAISMGKWMHTQSDDDLRAFQQQVKQAARLNPQSSSLHEEIGRWWLDIHERSGDRTHAKRAAEWLEKAVRRRPHNNINRAYWAWALHQAGERPEARRQAAEALRLNELNPHLEQQLKRVPSPAGDGNAEQAMKSLRSV